MRHPSRIAPTAVLTAALLTALASCRAPSPRVVAPEPGPPPPAAHEVGSYDWHGLLIAPFGSALKDIPMALHEVLLFQDRAHDGAAADEGECYAADAPALRFVGRTLDEYLLCFKQDRLSRVQASVGLPAAEASDVLAATCAAAPAAVAPGATACDGSDGAVRFRGRLEEESILSITLDDVSNP